MKKVFGILFVLGVILFGCNEIGTVFQPLIGSWETTILEIEVGATFHANGVATETNSLGELGVTRNGTWESTEDIVTVTWDDGSSDQHTYSFNSDHSEMTLAPHPSGVAIIYNRK